MEPLLESRLAQIEQKIDAVYVSVEKTRTYLLWTMIGTILVFVLPLIATAFFLPSFIQNYTETLQSLTI